MEYRSKNLSILNNDDRKFQGYLSVEVVDKQGEIIPIDELEKVMDTLMSRGGFIIDSHSNRVVGKMLNWAKVDKDSKPAIQITGEIFRNWKVDDMVWDSIKTGKYAGLSFGGANAKKEGIKMGGRDVNVLSDLESYEVSVCERPANPEALITEVNTLAKSEDTNKVEVSKIDMTAYPLVYYCQVCDKVIHANSPQVRCPNGHGVQLLHSNRKGEELTDEDRHAIRSRDEHEEEERKNPFDRFTHDPTMGGNFHSAKMIEKEDKVRCLHCGAVMHPDEYSEHLVREHPNKSSYREWVKFTKEEIMKPFAGFKDWDSCMAKMRENYDEETAQKVCGRLKADHEDNKSVDKGITQDLWTRFALKPDKLEEYEKLRREGHSVSDSLRILEDQMKSGVEKVTAREMLEEEMARRLAEEKYKPFKSPTHYAKMERIADEVKKLQGVVKARRNDPDVYTCGKCGGTYVGWERESGKDWLVCYECGNKWVRKMIEISKDTDISKMDVKKRVFYRCHYCKSEYELPMDALNCAERCVKLTKKQRVAKRLSRLEKDWHEPMDYSDLEDAEDEGRVRTCPDCDGHADTCVRCGGTGKIVLPKPVAERRETYNTVYGKKALGICMYCERRPVASGEAGKFSACSECYRWVTEGKVIGKGNVLTCPKCKGRGGDGKGDDCSLCDGTGMVDRAQVEGETLADLYNKAEDTALIESPKVNVHVEGKEKRPFHRDREGKVDVEGKLPLKSDDGVVVKKRKKYRPSEKMRIKMLTRFAKLEKDLGIQKNCERCGASMGSGGRSTRRGVCQNCVEEMGLEDENKSDVDKGKRYEKRCPICHVKIPEEQRTCDECAKVLRANPHLAVTDLM